jgi:ABC-2 type transport system ATP-binding protein
MFEDPATHSVEITFIGSPPTRRIAQAAGVTDVEVDGRTVRCRVYGSFQPFLEAVRGYEVTSLTAIPVLDATEPERPKEVEPMAEA